MLRGTVVVGAIPDLLYPGAMASSRRLLQAAAALSACLSERSIPHAFHGTITATVLGSSVDAQDIFCIVEGAPNAHPFRRVREAVADNEDFRITNSPWSNSQDSLSLISHQLLSSL